MKSKEASEDNISHKAGVSETENYRQVSLVVPTMTIHLISSFEKENIEYLSGKALELLKHLRQEGK